MVSSKRDRTARLVRLGLLVHRRPRGLTAREIARRLGVSIRTAYRDIVALDEVGIPVWEERGRFGTESTAFLPPLDLTLLEAVTLFLSARLMARYADKRDPHIVTTSGKLTSILPAPIAQHVYATIALVNKRPPSANYHQVFDLLATAWAEGRKVRIWYPYQHPDGRRFVNERLVCPYFLEPSPTGHACYLIGHDAFTGAVRTFKIERIERAELTDERFEVPSDFDATARFKHAWVVADEAPVTVRLRFHDHAAAGRARENRWHPTQREVVLPDGGLALEFVVGGVQEITPWILSWGDVVEVLEPPDLRQRVAAIARRLASRYVSCTGASHA